MPNRWPRLDRDSTIWRVAVALLLSLLLHSIILAFVHVDLSILKPEAPLVEVSFAHLAKSPPAAETVKETVPEAAATVPVARPEITTKEPQVAPADATTIPELVTEPASVERPAEIPTQASEELEAESMVTQLGSDISETDALPYEYVEADFDILRGKDGYKVGQSKVRYESKDGRYLLLSESEAKGFASLFLSGQLIQRSQGLVTSLGLQPQEFLYQYGKSGRQQRALFDWDNRRLTLETDKARQTSRLPSDAQDLMSFMYQFMFVPPLQEMQLNITNGKRMKAYGYTFVGEEELSTKMGVVRVMHIENINDDGDEKNEIWLAVDYRFLPVKLRKTEKDGSVIEQVLTSINTENLQ
jgi:hypothetical protein